MKKLSYERAYERLEEIMKELEKGTVDLDESLKLYEEGIGLYRHCSALLENAQLKITKLSKQEYGVTEESFEIQED